MNTIKFFYKVSFFFYVFFILYGCASTSSQPDPSLTRLIDAGKARASHGWVFVKNHPQKIKYQVLLLPGLSCTDVIFTDMLNDPSMENAGIHLVAADPPGFKGLPLDDDFEISIENYAILLEELTQRENYDLIVGHSFFANVAIEIGARNNYAGKLMLLSPSLYTDAEPFDVRLLDSMTRVPGIGYVSMQITYQMLDTIFEPYLAQENKGKVNLLVKEAQKTHQDITQKQLNAFFDHIETYENLTDRLLTANNQIFYVIGTEDNIEFSDAVRKKLSGNKNITIKDIENGKHFLMIDHPKKINALIADFLEATEE
jgi:pimeloyl-ACP methyl ester carboxylesterase